ncbi:alanine racemase [bacterium endosymbiont of Pedicinus badii]|uniref:alanine racemase n=1 Tax=bacterium endosymbiont of Pedicinus badii TaxID=1719126 RepID=UPI0009BA9454|nr:alanine racemase [bacterium endosymbiont of Pedicinus badii]OQM34413.1 hypothetical protein AOQ89_00800 [bacterium endosymbiont of Pedicinus badii]
MYRPVFININLKNFSKNLSIIKKIVQNSFIWAVVKSNAYGHSLMSAILGLKKANGFAVLEIREAIFLRKNGWKKPILLLCGFFKKEELELIVKYRITLVIHNKWQVKILKNSSFISENIFIKLNSGMNRLGFDKKNFIKFWIEMKKTKKFSNIILMTHFYNTNSKKSTKKIMYTIKNISTKIPVNSFCLANSASMLLSKETHLDFVRPGILLYGVSPSKKFEKKVKQYKIKPVMTLQSEIISIQEFSNIRKNFGYYNKEKKIKSRKVGIVACGYNDGYPKKIRIGHSYCLVEGKKCFVIFVCMNMMVVDLQFCPQASLGSKVELWGENIKINEVAEFCQTSSYQIFSNISKDIRYFYKK